MKILLISSRFHPFTGGVENVVLNLAKQLTGRFGKDQVLVIASRMGIAEKEKEEVEGVVVRRIWMNLPRSVPGFLIFPVRFVIGLIGLTGEIRQFEPNVINYHFPDDSSVYVWLAHILFRGPAKEKNQALRPVLKPGFGELAGPKELGAVKLILNIHGNDLQVFGKKPWYRFFLRQLIERTQTIIVNSNYIKNELGKDFPEALVKTRIIPNGVDEELFELAAKERSLPIPQSQTLKKFQESNSFPWQAPKTPYILCLGRLVPKKGVDILIKAFTKVQNELEDNLVIVGDGPERTKLENIVKKAGLEPRVTFTGNQTGKNRLELIRQAKFAVMPSRREPFGIVALELMAAGKALIASQTGGLAETIENGRTGIFFENENVEDLAGKLIRLDGNEELRRQLGKNAHQEAKKYRWEETAERYLSVFSI